MMQGSPAKLSPTSLRSFARDLSIAGCIFAARFAADSTFADAIIETIVVGRTFSGLCTDTAVSTELGPGTLSIGIARLIRAFRG